MSIRTVLPYQRIASILVIITLFALTPVRTQAANLNPGVFPPNSKPYGSSYSLWSAKWWQWAFSIPEPVNPLTDETGEDCGRGQAGPVWFLGGTFIVVETAEGELLGQAERDCTIPAGKAIFIPVINAECSTVEGNGTTEQELRDCAVFFADHVTSVEVTVDGVPLVDLDPPDSPFRVQSPLFEFKLPPDNLIGFDTGGRTITSPSVSDGYWVMLKPLSRGEHTVHFTAVADFTADLGFVFTLDITYHLTIAGGK
jgi:hypothetical protein